jgi:hypothetical protein
MARVDFGHGLRKLGLDPEEFADGRIIFPYNIPAGPQQGQAIRLGFVVGDDFPLNPPSGPHLSPRLLPINTAGGLHPLASIHESPTFGSDWEYWSRPYPNPPGWANTDRSVKVYLKYIEHLFRTL